MSDWIELIIGAIVFFSLVAIFPRIMIPLIIIFLIVCYVLAAKEKAGNSRPLDEKIKNDTKFLLDTGIKIVSNNPDGGFIKFYFEAKDSELQIHLCDTHLLRDFQYFDSKSKYMSGYFRITERDAERFLTLTKIHVNQKYRYDDWMSFDYYYPENVSRYALKEWVEEYFKSYYSKYELKSNGNTLSVMISN